jgi:hypothetical protein
MASMNISPKQLLDIVQKTTTRQVFHISQNGLVTRKIELEYIDAKKLKEALIDLIVDDYKESK